jgi:phage tail-like protein
MAASNSPANRRDPMPVFCFKVTFQGVAGESDAEAFFRSVSGIKYETEVLDVRAGGVNDTTFRLPGATKWANITLKRGFSGSSGFMQWRQEWLSGKFTRASGSIVQLDTELKVITTWKFEEAWPVKWEVSDFDATKSELSIETLELAHHGLKVG